ncbi:MAG: 2-amino-3,7-dideoxy-D-threo-hept-6-ulosonate synthase [Thermoplasmatota archaeon]
MSQLGKSLRLRRLFERGRTVLIPMDHGVSIGPVAGIEDPRVTVDLVAKGGANAVVVQKGLLRLVAGSLGSLGVMVHLSASTDLNPDPNDKRVVATVEEVVSLGADGVSIHVNVGAASESRMIEDLGRIATSCEAFGMPLLAMMYPRGHEITDPHDLKYVRHVARIASELGADVIKVPYTGNVASFREVVRGCGQPIVVSGGPKMGNDRDVLEMVHGAIAAGAAGVSVGRNIWQHADPLAMTRAVSDIIHKNASVEEAITHLKGDATNRGRRAA